MPARFHFFTQSVYTVYMERYPIHEANNEEGMEESREKTSAFDSPDNDFSAQKGHTQEKHQEPANPKFSDDSIVKDHADKLLGAIESSGADILQDYRRAVPEKTPKKKEIYNPSRRRFLGNVMKYTAGGVVASIPILGRMFGHRSEEGYKEEDVAKVNAIAKELDTLERDDSIERRERFIAHVRETGEFIPKDEDTILDESVMEALTDYWVGRFMKRRDNRENVSFAWEDILLACARMRPYLPAMRQAFKQQGLSETLVGVAIVESWGDRFARSHSGAKGLYQFTDTTGRMYGLKTDDDFFNPSASSQAAAEYIAMMYNANGGSLPLALHEYNGGYALTYRLEHSEKNGAYAGFLKDMESKINNIKHSFGDIDKETFYDEIYSSDGRLHGLYENITYPAKVFAAEHALRQVDADALKEGARLARI